MTSLLQDQLGGNCRTRVLVCFSPFSDPSATSELFQLADNLSKVKNFPLLNEAFAQVCHSLPVHMHVEFSRDMLTV